MKKLIIILGITSLFGCTKKVTDTVYVQPTAYVCTCNTISKFNENSMVPVSTNSFVLYAANDKQADSFAATFSVIDSITQSSYGSDTVMTTCSAVKQ